MMLTSAKCQPPPDPFAIFDGISQRTAVYTSDSVKLIMPMHLSFESANLSCSKCQACAADWRQRRGLSHRSRSRYAASAVYAQSLQVPQPAAAVPCASRRQVLQTAAIGTLALPLVPGSAAADASKFITTPSGLKIEDIREGTGTMPAAGPHLPIAHPCLACAAWWGADHYHNWLLLIHVPLILQATQLLCTGQAALLGIRLAPFNGCDGCPMWH
jgi:hypothetical protein